MAEYIKTMREIVGRRPILICGASVIVENTNGEILLQLRTDNNCWGYAGGSVELDEIAEEAAKRELFEETGLIAEKLELYGIFSGPEMHYVYPNGDEVSIVDIVYICKDYKGSLKIDNNEVKKLQFYSKNNLPENISPPNVLALSKYVSESK